MRSNTLLSCNHQDHNANGSIKAHLKDLGLSKPAQALVWMAGPVAGITIQPYCGIRSDQCLTSWGRRRPFIAWGAVAAVTSLLGLASAERLAAVLVRLCAGSCSSADADSREEPVRVAAANITVLFIVALNIALQPLQGGLRALIADMCPRTQQPTATAVAGTVVSASNILCYTVGFVDLRRIAVLRALGGDSQFAILCILTSITLAISVGLTCLSVRERCAVLGGDGRYTRAAAARGTRYTVRAQLWYLCTSFPRLPQQVQQVFKVQFFSWMGWFPFLFFTTTYIGETCK
jgi:solute carrier family 45 protein 1/2/4